MAQQIRVGITLALTQAGESLWVNGIKQNAIFLCEALKACPSVADVRLVNMAAEGDVQAPWDTDRWPLVSFGEAKDSVDVLIELGAQVSADQTDYLKSRGARLVSYCCGVEYVNVAQAIIFSRDVWPQGIYINPRYDAVWVIPQVADTSEHFFRSLRRCPCTVVPFVWNPVFLQERSLDLPHQGEYVPRSGAARVSVIEPNIDLVKFCLYPVLIAEEVFRQRPDLLGFLHVANSMRFADNSPAFVSLMSTLDLVQANKAAFIDRFDTPELLALHTDAVVSHQWGNPLNYLYLEVCWQGFPLIHNASLCPTLGYYYQGNDVVAGAAALQRALTTHDQEWQAYKRHQRSAIAAYLPDHPAVTERYDNLLNVIMKQPIR